MIDGVCGERTAFKALQYHQFAQRGNALCVELCEGVEERGIKDSMGLILLLALLIVADVHVL